MAASTEVSAVEWLKIRNAVAIEIKKKTNSNATEKIAEHLLLLGWIDVDAVKTTITPTTNDPNQDEQED